jgi:hypothetical protein
MRNSIKALAGAVAGVLVAGTAFAQDGGTCDEQCLKGFMDSYLDALVAHDPSAVPVAADYRYTENGAEVRLGEALWGTIKALGAYRHDVYEPETGGVATFVSLQENDFPDLVSIRLKVENNRITQIETIVSRRARNAGNLPPKDPSWMELFDRVEPEETRLTREELIEGAINYMRAVAFVDGKIAPFATSCIRLENGGTMALGPGDVSPVPMLGSVAGEADTWFTAIRKTFTMGCADQLNTGAYDFITGFESANFPVVDVERQIVYGTFNFMRRGDEQGVTMDGKNYDFPDAMRYPNEMLNSEAWKFIDGKISRVEAVFTGPQAYKLGTGWGGTEPVSRPVGAR